ncbi:MAG: hypothetical protein HQL67_05165 [Magnetococcales bacterium]|nr:hypothetical protein [Magnetococcales bacterium]
MAPEPNNLFCVGDHCSLSPDGGDSGYHHARERIKRLLIRDTLVDSLSRFSQHKQSYPFVVPSHLRPGHASSSKEYHLHNSALVILLNGHLPDKLRKHFRCREGNRLRMNNLVDVAPDLAALRTYNPQQRYSTHPDFETLIQQLLPLDFSLLIQQSLDEERHDSVYELSHFHVKVERILDNALRSMGIYLNYLEKNLYERGDEFADRLEKKFFEYFNFYHNSAGRRSAATLAAQLLARENQEGTVFITSQQDRRLTLFSTTKHESSLLRKTRIEHFTLIKLNPIETKRLREWGQQVGLKIGTDFMITRKRNEGVFVLRTQFEHTPAALPVTSGALRSEINVREKWVRLVSEQIVSLKPTVSETIHFPCVYQNETDWNKVKKIIS